MVSEWALGTIVVKRVQRAWGYGRQEELILKESKELEDVGVKKN